MRTTIFLTRLMTAIVLFSMIAISCNKETSQSGDLSPQEEQEVAMVSSESESEAEIVFDDVFNNVIGVNDEVGVAGIGVFGRATTNGDINGDMFTGRTDSIRCYTVTVTRLNAPNLFPVKIIVDFGNGCVGRDGHIRYGKIVTVYTGRLINPGSLATTEFDNFKIDSISVEGRHTIKNTTGNTTGSNLTQFTVDVDDAKLTKPNGNYSKWDSHKVRTQIEGNGSVGPQDDVFKVTGSANGTVKRNNLLFAWRSEISEPLIKKFFCRWVSKGIIKTWRATLSNTSPWTAILNFGNGNCDNQATLTINGTTHQITLH